MILKKPSKDTESRAQRIFNKIAAIYSLFDKKLQKTFAHSVSILNREIPVKNKRILDAGTGTGAWAACFYKYHPEKIHGIDFSENMISQAEKNHPNIQFSVASADKLHEFPDNSFDIVTASHMLHGPDQSKREQILKEFKRVSGKYVVLYDFSGKTPIFVRILEFLEKSDYKHFKKNICNELKREFSSVKIIHVKYGTALYIAVK